MPTCDMLEHWQCSARHNAFTYDTYDRNSANRSETEIRDQRIPCRRPDQEIVLDVDRGSIDNECTESVHHNQREPIGDNMKKRIKKGSGTPQPCRELNPRELSQVDGGKFITDPGPVVPA
jgi:hypothetical protein